MFKEAGLSLMLIIYLMAVYTLCGIVGLALHYPFRNCELEGSVIDVGVLKQNQIIGHNGYFTDPESGNFYTIIPYSSIMDTNNISYSFTNDKMRYEGVVSFHKLYVEDGRTWMDAIIQYLSRIASAVVGVITMLWDMATIILDTLLSWIGYSSSNPDPGMAYLSEITKPGYTNPKFEFCYTTPQAVLIDRPLDDGSKVGEYYIICTTNYIKASTG